MKYMLLLLILIACCVNVNYRDLWYCDNHKDNIGEHNFGKGHLCLDELCKKSANLDHGCKDWTFKRVEVR